MLKELRIQNFKAWKDTGAIKMSPITLFFGANSSGKSSIGQFLMLLRQTVQSSDRKAVLYPGGSASPVQLGSFHEMVYGRDDEKSVSFSYSWDMPSYLLVVDPLSHNGFSGNTVAFDATIGMGGGQKRKTLHVAKFEYQLSDGKNVDVDQLDLKLTRKAPESAQYELTSSNYKLVRNQGRVWDLKSPERFYGFPEEVMYYHQNASFVQDLRLAHENLFTSIHYLGPLRERAARLYAWSGTEPEDVGSAGENMVAAILAADERKLSLGYKKKGKPFQQLIAEKLKEMELIEEFEVNPISKGRQQYEVKVRVKGSPEMVDLPDVGFGVSQVLPVLVQCFYAQPNSIIIMEQPEIHLHPKAQALLADVMIDVINSRENGEDRNIQLIIESHSEHFLTRLQRRIAEVEGDKAITSDKVSAYFAHLDRAPARLEPLEIDELGNVKNWPVNFFGDTMGDVVARTVAQSQRMTDAEAPHD